MERRAIVSCPHHLRTAGGGCVSIQLPLLHWYPHLLGVMQGWWSTVGFPSHSVLSSKMKPSQIGLRSVKHLHSQSPHSDSTMMLNVTLLVTPGLQHHSVQCQIPNHPRVPAPPCSMSLFKDSLKNTSWFQGGSRVFSKQDKDGRFLFFFLFILKTFFLHSCVLVTCGPRTFAN